MSSHKSVWLNIASKCMLLLLTLLIAVSVCGCGSSDSVAVSTDKIKAYSANEAGLKSNRFTGIEPKRETVSGLSLDGFEKVIENDAFACYYKESVCGIRIEDKRNGYVWGSLATEKPENLNKKWSCYANSIVAIEYSPDSSAIVSSGASAEDVTCKENNGKLTFGVNFKELNISFSFDMILTDFGFSFKLDEKTVKEGEKNKLVSISFVPYFGSVYGSEKSGYMFVPDGCGALIRYNDPRSYLEGFSKRVYGVDYGIDSMAVINDLGAERINAFETESKTVSMPVFGMAHGSKQNAYIAIIKNGDEYCEINAEPAGIITDYNRAYASFIYRSTYEQPVSKKSAGIYTVQKEINRISPEISYYLLCGEDADYVGMAKCYREYLESNNILSDCGVWENNVALRLDFAVADVQKNFIGSSVKKITDASDVINAVKFLQSKNVKNIDVNLLGCQKGGLHGYDISKTDLKLIFGDSDLNLIENLLKKGGGKLKYGVNVFSGSEKQFAGKSDYAITMSQNIALIPSDDEGFLTDRYLAKPKKALDVFSQLTKESGYVFYDFGNMLYGEYLEDDVTTRKQVFKTIKTAVNNSGSRKYGFAAPNSYMYKITSEYYNTPAVSSQYVFETDTVPFLQIVLSGHIKMYSPYINCSFYSVADILKLIDYNCYPSFILTGKENYDLRNTACSDLQSSRISDWQEYIADTYSKVNSVLSKVVGSKFASRTVIDYGFVKNDYENGSVYVNYTSSDKKYGDVSVAKESAVFVAKEE